MKRRLLAVLVSTTLLLTCISTHAWSQENQSKELSIVKVNPVYESEVSVEEAVKTLSAKQKAPMVSSGEVYTNIEDAAAYVKDQIKKRNEHISFDSSIPFEWTQDDLNRIAGGIVSEACKHTGNPDEGDYMLWQFGEYQVGVSGSDVYKIELTFNYYTNANQESQVTNKVNEILDGLNLDELCTDEKVKKIYGYLTDNVEYDTPGSLDPNDSLCHTAYAALIEGTSVCQGYSVALYRMLLSEGIGCRVIAGDGGGPHAWNIIQVGDKWYNADATWDAPRNPYEYFLRNNANFGNHTPEDMTAPDEYGQVHFGLDYTSQEFWTQHPLSTVDYNLSKLGHDFVQGEAEEAPTCTKDGRKGGSSCSKCGKIEGASEIIPALGHKEITDPAKAATCTEDGHTEGIHCERCNEIIKASEVIPAGHSWSAPQIIKKATTDEDGSMKLVCEVCNDVKESEVIPKIATTEIAAYEYIYSGNEIAPEVTVKDSTGKDLIKDTDYTVAYENNTNVGLAKVNITFKDKYEGTKTIEYKINPKGTKISKLSKAKKAITVKWKKVSQITGYEIRYSLKSKMSGAKIKTVKGFKKTSLKISKLKAKKKYFVQIRTYKTVSGKKYVSKWSTSKSVKTK